MSNLKSKGRTIGEVEKLTGIPRRKLKYFIEQKIMQPSEKAENGYWLYNDEDVRKLRIILLYREMGYPDNKLSTLVSDPDFPWQEELDAQIVRLLGCRQHTEDQLFTAEFLRYIGYSVSDWRSIDSASLRDGNGEHYFEAGPIPRLTSEAKRSVCTFFYRLFEQATEKGGPLSGVAELWDKDPKSQDVQNRIALICAAFKNSGGLSPEMLLFDLRLAGVFSGMEIFLDLILGQKGGVQFLTDAVQIYCDKLTKTKAERNQIKIIETEE